MALNAEVYEHFYQAQEVAKLGDTPITLNVYKNVVAEFEEKFSEDELINDVHYQFAVVGVCNLHKLLGHFDNPDYKAEIDTYLEKARKFRDVDIDKLLAEEAN